MKFKTQSQVLEKMESETRQTMRKHEELFCGTFLKMWEQTRKDLKAAIAVEYIQDFSSGTWDIATANGKGTIYRIEKTITETLTHFHNTAHTFIKGALAEVHKQEILRALWMLDQTTPLHVKPVYPITKPREAATPRDYKAGWPEALDTWIKSYKDALMGNLRMEILHEGGVADAAAEVDKAKIDNFDPAYKFESLFSTNAIQAEADARRYVADSNPEIVMTEIWQSMEDSRECETCAEYNGRERADVPDDMPVHFNCRCYYRLVPKPWADALASGDADMIAAAHAMDAQGLVPDAMAIMGPDGKLVAHLTVDFPTWLQTVGADYAPIQGEYAR